MFQGGQAATATLASRPVSLHDLLERICVRPPYFALHDLRIEEDVFCATAAAELAQGLEAGPMQAAEISRHGAIAGLCAAAQAQGDQQRRYYLAQEATYVGVPNEVDYGTPVTLRAQVLDLNKRQAQVQIRVVAAGQDVAALEVLYTILTDSAFSRLFRSRHQPGFGDELQTELATLPRSGLSRQGEGLVQQIDRVPEHACAGHFDGYPAMPVAILMGQLAQLAGQTLESGFYVARAQVQARDFCWAGESARFVVQPVMQTGGQVVFECEAQSNDRTVGQMRLFLDRR